MIKKLLLAILLFFSTISYAEDGYRLWLRYDKIQEATILTAYQKQIENIYLPETSNTTAVIRQEWQMAIKALIGKNLSFVDHPENATIVFGAPKGRNFLGVEGFSIQSKKENKKSKIFIAANTEKGFLYASYHFLRLLQTQQPIDELNIVSVPQVKKRILNHWDNLTRYVERGYAGISIFNWHTLPEYLDSRYIDYARANASIGINGTVLTNVNANATVLTKPYLQKVKALADVFRPYGIQVYLTARFSAPIEIGGLKTADPLEASVQQWWKEKAKEIYSLIPDFGGFLVKANSEGQPGPQDYKRTHAEGANMLADAVAPYNGIVMWRAFVYSNEIDEDRFKQAYNEFQPLDGKFRKNVMVQVKNGPIDFQPREPFHPLFGAMPNTPLMMEFQLTQEYLGQATHLVYQAPMFKEILNSDTYAKGEGSTVAKVIDGTLNNHELTGIAGVANIGNDMNWTGHLFGQANWYMFGRLTWDLNATEKTIAEEWIRQTFSNKKKIIATIKNMMLSSYEAMVNYMTPLGLHHIMGNGHHYGPMPWGNSLPRADWNPVYFHKADDKGIGFDRTSTGSNGIAQFAQPLQEQWKNSSTTNEKLLLWFHHVPWNYKMKSGRTLWEELCFKYNEGVNSIRTIESEWKMLEGKIDAQRFNHVKQLLAIQVKEAVWWRDACLSYFQTFAKQPIPVEYEQPAHPLSYYQSLSFPYAPGDGK